jgi:hypothetical protein
MGLQKDYRGPVSLIPQTSDSALLGDNRGGKNIEFGQLASKKRVFGKFCDELLKLCAGHYCVLLTQGRQRQQNFRKRPEIIAARGGDLELL